MIALFIILGCCLLIADGMVVAKRRFTPRRPDHDRIMECERECYIGRDDPDPLNPLDNL